MNTRTLAIVGAAVTGTPLLAAAVLALCSPAVAVIVCLAVAAAGVVGTAIGILQIGRWAHERRSPHAAEVDALARRDSR